MTDIILLQSPPPKLVDVQKSVFCPEALEFVSKLHKTFDYQIEKLYKDRFAKKAAIQTQNSVDFKISAERSDRTWKIGALPSRLQYVRVIKKHNFYTQLNIKI